MIQVTIRNDTNDMIVVFGLLIFGSEISDEAGISKAHAG